MRNIHGFGQQNFTFADLQSRLLLEARRRIQNGEFTERGLARISGLSQPHMHNLLKGVRELTRASADCLLAGLDIGVLDLVKLAELEQALEAAYLADSSLRIAPLANGRVGPGWPIPDLRQTAGWCALPHWIPDSGRRPVIVRLAPDPVLRAAFPGATEAVVDCDEMKRLQPREPSWYLLRHRDGGVIRQARLFPDRLEILGQTSLAGDEEPFLSIGSASVLHLVRGKLVWAGSGLDRPFQE